MTKPKYDSENLRFSSGDSVSLGVGVFFGGRAEANMMPSINDIKKLMHQCPTKLYPFLKAFLAGMKDSPALMTSKVTSNQSRFKNPNI
jgi:hypothetical protein